MFANDTSPFFTTLELAAALLAGYFALVVLRVVRNLFFSPIGHVPGPTLAKASELWGLWHQVHGRKFLQVHEAFKEHGPVVRVAPGVVSIADYKYLPAVYQSKLDKIPAYAGFTTNGGVENSFSAIFPHVAQGKRKGMLPHYATANLINWQPVFDEHMLQLVKVIEKIGCKDSVDVLSLLAHTLIDILGELVLDADVGGLSDVSEGKRNPIARAITLWPNRGTIMGQLHPVVWRLVSKIPVASWQAVVQSDSNLAKFVVPHVESIQQQIDSGVTPDRPCLIHRLATSIDPNTGKLWRADANAAECIDNFLAGTETTSTSMTYSLWLLSTRPHVLATLQAELDAHAELDEVLSLQLCARLPYLNAVIKESMRLYTPGPGTFDRIVAGDGMEVAGVFLPPGTVVGLQSYTCHRDASVWGEDVLEFRPERWLNETAEMKAAYIPFSLGGRNCPGQNLAWTDMRLLLSVIARNFSVLPAKETTEASMQPFDLTTVSPMSGECKLQFARRKAQ